MVRWTHSSGGTAAPRRHPVKAHDGLREASERAGAAGATTWHGGGSTQRDFAAQRTAKGYRRAAGRPPVGQHLVLGEAGRESEKLLRLEMERS